MKPQFAISISTNINGLLSIVRIFVFCLLLCLTMHPVQAQSISLIPNPTSGANSGFNGEPIVYNSKLYFSYWISSSTFQLAELNGVGGCVLNSTTKDGNWNDITVWSCLKIPTLIDPVSVGHVVTIPAAYIATAKQVMYLIGGRVVFGASTSKLQLSP